jgi:hypothetical protein
MAEGMSDGYFTRRGICLFNNAHEFPPDEFRRHNLIGGPGDCRCEPTVRDVYFDGLVTHRTIVHQSLQQSDRFYEEYWKNVHGRN